MFFIFSLMLCFTNVSGCSDTKSNQQKIKESGNPLMQSLFSMQGLKKVDDGPSFQELATVQFPTLKKVKSCTWQEWQEQQKQKEVVDKDKS